MVKKIIRRFGRFFVACLDALLRAFHACTRFLHRYPRIGRLVYGVLLLGFIGGGSYIGWLQWKLAQLEHDQHEAEVINRTEAELTAHGVSFADAATGKLSVELKVPGEIKLDGDKLAHMVPRFSGVVRQVLKNLGDVVKKGETLAVFENNANLAPFEMRSQLDGVIIEKNVALGEVIGNTDEAFVIADLSQVWVDLYIYPADLAKTKAGQRVRIIDQTAGRQAEGVLSYVAPTISDHTRTAMARVILPNPDMAWRPGTFVTGAIVIDESEVPVTVDAESVQDISGVPTVFVKKDDSVVATPVRVGRRDDKRIEVLEGVTPGMRIATSGSFLLKSELTKGSAEHKH